MVTSVITEMGGVGKSSIIFNLSWYMADKGKKILIVDTDAQIANISRHCGVQDLDNKIGITELLSNPQIPTKKAIINVKENLDIIPANENASLLIELLGKLEREKVSLGKKNMENIKSVLKPIRNDYDFIFIDTPPSPSKIHFETLVASDNIVVPVLPDGKSNDGTRGIIATYEAIKSGYNKDLKVLALVYNKKDNRKRYLSVSQSTIDMLCKIKDLILAETEIPDNAPISETYTFKCGITDTNKRSTGAKSIIKLAKELYGVE